jgi:phosphatidylserine decarboxylase
MHNFIPNLILTRVMGSLANSKNTLIKWFLINSFIKIYQPKLEESLISDIKDFPTYNSFFTRELKKEARPIESSELTIVSPVDGTITDHGIVENNMLIQAKKHSYPLEELLGNEPQNTNGSQHYFITIYLAPRDYHRIHCPYEGLVSSTSHIGESLFSVNKKAQVNIPYLYIKNERAVIKIESSLLSYSLVSVGASIVGSIVPFWSDLESNTRKDYIKEWNQGPKEEERQALKGQELAHFKMGSTVILVFEDSSKLDLHSLTTNKAVKFGSKLINLKNL